MEMDVLKMMDKLELEERPIVPEFKLDTRKWELLTKKERFKVFEWIRKLNTLGMLKIN